LIEATASFWTDAELVQHLADAARELWRAIINLHERHFYTVNESSVSMAPSQSTLAGVPGDGFRVTLLEPTDVTTLYGMLFQHRNYEHAEFCAARAEGAVDPAGRTIFWDLLGEGPNVSTASIYVAPQSNSTVSLRIGYIRNLSSLSSATTSSTNPIPGESDDALVAYCVAHARAKEREDRSPDPEWMAIYGTAKKNLLAALTPRVEPEAQEVEGVFEAWW